MGTNGSIGTGTVEFNVNGINKVVLIDESGVASCEYTFNSTGTYPVVADYLGQSAILSQVIKNKVKSVELVTNFEAEIKMSDLKVYPNPFPDILKFEFNSPVSTYVRIDIYDISGRYVKTIFDNYIDSSTKYHAEFKPISEISGVYVYKMKIGDSVEIGRVIYKNDKRIKY